MTTYSIYFGYWINWSQGKILGATITLSQRSGGILISFIATFMALVGAQLWRIVSFAIHQGRPQKGELDGLYYQQQNIFRNTSSPGGAAWSFTLQMYYWRGKARHTILRTLPWALLAVLYLLLSGALATFSSEISVSAGNARRIQGQDSCGYWLTNLTSTEGIRALTQKTANDTLVAANYARHCYGTRMSQQQCGTFPVGSIDWISEQNSTCPFDSGMCVYGDTAAFNMVSVAIDSHTHLGINAPNENRVQLKKQASCAPLVQLLRNVSSSGESLLNYEYGSTNTGNYTWQYNTHAIMDDIGYTTKALASYYPVSADDAWVPIPALRRADTDLSIVFIASNSILFQEPCDDPVFSAHIPKKLDDDLAYYNTDFWAVAITCAEQYQICNPYTNSCTQMLGIKQLTTGNALLALNLNPVQKHTADRIIQAAIFTNIYQQVTTRMAGALRASETVAQLEQQPLPANQWQIELGSWFDTGLARLQYGVQEYVTGPSNVAEGSYVFQPAKDGNSIEADMCVNQLVLDSSDSISFSVLGMALILIVGSLIIVTSFVLDTVVGKIQTKIGRGEKRKEAWMNDDKLQLQRSVLHSKGPDSWEDPPAYPTTKRRGLLSDPMELTARDGSCDHDTASSGKNSLSTSRQIPISNH
ncbi:hypothetical protein LTR84_005522 [Exophiala bonariae]|uniref:Uncharacterized protein n=1 Tax=Exophiala bonariae TaxID=1690606 RepID=A0AAV9N480_9EURO|nr:hypothetical protein LTR84_005522 [Exophiala bonariae]